MPGESNDAPSDRVRVIESWFDWIRHGAEGASWAWDKIGEWDRELSHEERWSLILEMIRRAPDDDCLGFVAAGPLEDLLSEHGEQLIDRVEERAGQDDRFARTLTNVWQCGMSDLLYARVKALQARATEPLRMIPGPPIDQEKWVQTNREMLRLLEELRGLIGEVERNLESAEDSSERLGDFTATEKPP
jgi:hypothetical protein